MTDHRHPPGATKPTCSACATRRQVLTNLHQTLNNTSTASTSVPSFSPAVQQEEAHVQLHAVGPTSARQLEQQRPVQLLILDDSGRDLSGVAAELSRRGISAEDLHVCTDSTEALRALDRQPATAVVAFLGWPLDEAGARSLLSALRAGGAYVLAMLPPDRWVEAETAPQEGADDVVLLPCPPEALAARAVLAMEAARRSRPSPWHRPRFVLRQALSHATGGEVIVRGRAGTTRVLVSRGLVAWVHDDADRGSWQDALRAFGVTVTTEQLTSVLEECRLTREHVAEVLARWGIAERDVVQRATRSLVDARLKRALSDADAAALFVPGAWHEPSPVGYTREELDVPRATLFPPPPPSSRGSRPSFDAERLSLLGRVAQDVFGVGGCVSAAVLHYGSATVVSAAGETSAPSLAWSLGAALHELEDTAADAMLCSGDRCHLARRIAGSEGCFVYAAFDLATTSIALARLSVGTAAARSFD